MGEKTGEYIYQIVKDSDGGYCYIKQGELIRCKDCKHKGTKNCVANALTIAFHSEVKDDFYCGLAERRTDD